MTGSTEESRRAGPDEGHQPIVLPPPKEGETYWRRRRRPPWWAVVAAVLLAVLGLYEAVERGWFDPGGRDAQARPEASGARAEAARPADGTSRFHALADSLDRAAEGYRVRRSDYEQNRIGCPTLATGYRRVDRHFVALSVVMREEGDRLDAGARRRYEELTNRVNDVYRHFDGAGCRSTG